MKIKFWLFAALFAAAGMTTMTSCEKESKPDDGGTIPPPEPTPDPTAADMKYINEWMDGYMTTHYLWNTEYKQFKPNYDQESKAFLSSALNFVAAQNDVNREDGHWVNGKREYFYSSLGYQPVVSSNTRYNETQAFGFGFTGIVTGLVDGNYYFGILGVVPDSPADKAKMTRGMFISKIDGQVLTSANINDQYKKLFPTTGVTRKFSLQTLVRNDDLTVTVTPIDPANITAATYTDDPIIMAQIAMSKEDPNMRVGYLAYNSFNAAFDQQLINQFQLFKDMAEQNGGPLSDMILDLRYNSGGYLKSSVMLATLIAGNKYKDQLYCRTTYNNDRITKGEKPEEYHIGNKKISALEGGTYDLIEQALAASLNMDRVYVLTSERTASASELIINGLKGLGVDVRLIGDVTNGKNVGMEGLSFNYNGFLYDFNPITMRLENAVGFSDYSNGFTPDVLIPKPDANYMLGNYLTSYDALYSYAIFWIKDGAKPDPNAVAVQKTRGAVPFTVGEPRFAKSLEGTIVKGIVK